MSDYRRCFVPGGTFFLTLVTYNRHKILTSRHGRNYLHLAISEVRRRHPFSLIATVLLPDHWHLVMQLPPGDLRYSSRIRQIKAGFSRQWIDSNHDEASVTTSQERRGERGVWQPRYWEHTIRDEDDLERCVDYVHWNPRKHELTERVLDWPWSSFHRFVAIGHYERIGVAWPRTRSNQVNGANRSL